MDAINYLDNAATSFPKPQRVSLEMARCVENYCGSAGRGSHRLSLAAANRIYDCREALAELLHVDGIEKIVFVPSCTYGLNLIIKGYLKRGDHVLISDMEHNAVLRPLNKLRREGVITFDSFCALSTAERNEECLLSEIESRIKRNTRLIICNHQSNICSYALPLKRVGELCKRYGIALAVDAAQSAGHLDIDVQQMNISFLSAAGHKGLYGPQGSAFVVINSPYLLQTIVEGGVGINSLDNDMPDFLPERFEVGTLPLPSIVGLCEGIRYVRHRTLENVRSHEQMLFRYAREKLMNMDNIRVYLPDFEGSTLLFNVEKLSAEEVGVRLDSENICVRAGFHCSALAHKSLATLEYGGVRASFGMFNTKKDVDRLVDALNRIC